MPHQDLKRNSLYWNTHRFKFANRASRSFNVVAESFPSVCSVIFPVALGAGTLVAVSASAVRVYSLT